MVTLNQSKEREKIIQEKIDQMYLEMQEENFTAEDIENLQAQKDFLCSLKRNISILHERHQLVSKTEFLNKKRLRAVEKSTDSNNKMIKRKFYSVELLLLVISFIIILLTLGSWLEVYGYRINLWNLNERINVLQSIGIMQNDVSLGIKCMCYLSLLCAGLYCFVVIFLCMKKESIMPYVASSVQILTFIIFKFVVFNFNGAIADSMAGYSLVKINLTWNAWGAFLLACLLGLVYYLREKINFVLSVTNDLQIEKNRELSITNYYPWMQLRFTTLILEQNDKISFEIRYINFPNQYSSKKERKFINMCVDIALKVKGDISIVPHCAIQINCQNEMGKTKCFIIENAPFRVDDIEDAKVIIESVEDSNDYPELLYSMFVNSEMNSLELNKYRDRIGNERACCSIERFHDNWRCNCGIYHTYDALICPLCGSKQDGFN